MGPSQFTRGEIETYFRVRVPSLKRDGREWRGPCPLHDGKHDSFAVNPDTGQAYCHSKCGRGWDLLGLEMALTSSDGKVALRQILGIIGRISVHRNGGHRSQIVETYDYRDEALTLLYQVVRYHPKGFKQRRPDDRGGWVWNLDGVSRVLYRLPEVIKADTVYLVEGEKDADTLCKWGLTATTNPGGAAKWTADYTDSLRGKDVVFIPDQDEKGQQHADLVGADLLRAGIRFRVVSLPTGKDVTEWKERHGGTLGLLQELVAQVPAIGFEQTNAAPVGRSSLGGAPGRPDEPYRNPDLRVGPPPTGWPVPLAPEAYHGCIGRIVDAIRPHTEADPVAILLQILVGFGNLIGRHAHFRVDGTKHFTNLYAVLVGQSSRGRKGTSWGHARGVLKTVDEAWVRERNTSGLSSGEGLITAVRDGTSEDAGVDDKRLLVHEPEFANVLKNADRQGNILSVVLRQAWDEGNLQVLTRNSTKATGALISVIGHITSDELRRYLTATEQANGFANRILWICVRRSQLLPLGGDVTEDLRRELEQLAGAAKVARSIDRIDFDLEAREMWFEVYPQLSRERNGLIGAVTSRSEAQTLRLACIYALLDGSATIGFRHMAAALEVWKYCEESAEFIFGGATGDSTADQILAGLKGHVNGLTRDEIRKLIFAGHKPADEITRALNALRSALLVEAHEEKTPGRPAMRWTLTGGARYARKAR